MGCYRKGDAADPEIYTRAIMAVLMLYPDFAVLAVTEPATGLPSKLKWLPTPAEVKEECEKLMAPIYREEERRERERLYRQSLPAPVDRSTRPTFAELQAKCAEVGIFIGGTRDRPTSIETVEKARERLGISQAQWDAIPDATRKRA